jgi:hypothetical protein
LIHPRCFKRRGGVLPLKPEAVWGLANTPCHLHKAKPWMLGRACRLADRPAPALMSNSTFALPNGSIIRCHEMGLWFYIFENKFGVSGFIALKFAEMINGNKLKRLSADVVSVLERMAKSRKKQARKRLLLRIPISNGSGLSIGQHLVYLFNCAFVEPGQMLYLVGLQRFHARKGFFQALSSVAQAFSAYQGGRFLQAMRQGLGKAEIPGVHGADDFAQIR